MHLIWKRPDGFVDSKPSDYRTIVIANKYNLWLHKSNIEWYPFQISGGWKEAEMTKKINEMVNLLDAKPKDFLNLLLEEYNDGMPEGGEAFVENQIEWLDSLRRSVKGDTWEKEIADHVIKEISNKIIELKQDFIKSIK